MSAGSLVAACLAQLASLAAPQHYQHDVIALHRDADFDRPIRSALDCLIRLRKVLSEIVQLRDFCFGQFFWRPHLNVGGICIIRVVPSAMHFQVVTGIRNKMIQLQLDGLGWVCRNHLRIKRPVAYLLVWGFEIPDYSRKVSTLRGKQGLWIARGDTVSLKRKKVLVSEEGRFADAVGVDKPKPPLKRSCRRPRLFEQVGICPVAHSLHFPLAGLELVENVWRTDIGIMYGVTRCVARAPLGEIQRKIRKWRSRDLFADTAHVSDDCVWRWGELCIAFPLFVEKAAINPVGVSCHEVNTRAALLDVRQKLGNPCCPSRSRTADTQSGIDRFNRPCCQVIKFEVRFLITALPKAGEVGLIPDLKKPRAHLLVSVALLDMSNKCIHQVVPACGVRVGRIAIPIEDAVLRSGQRLWREAEFNKRPDMTGQQIIIELIDL